MAGGQGKPSLRLQDVDDALAHHFIAGRLLIDNDQQRTDCFEPVGCVARCHDTDGLRRLCYRFQSQLRY